MDFLEYSDVSMEALGAMAPGRLKLTDSHVIFKNNKTGKVEQISSSDIDGASWQRFCGNWGIRIFTKSGGLHRFGGFKDGDKEKLAKFFSSRYGNGMLEKELSLKGWNWGTAKFAGSVLSFDVSNKLAFDVPLNYVSQCTTGKNEVTLEFHQNDSAPVSLMELRFHIPQSELAGDDPVDAFKDQVMHKASIISAVGDAIAIFREIPCLTPRGRYDVKIFQSFFQLHGKTFDYKIPMSTVLRLFLFPHKDGRQMFFVISLDPPIKQGQTRYHYLVFLLKNDEEVSIELPMPEAEIRQKYNDKLEKEMSGPLYEVISKIFKALVNRKITGPGSFKGSSGTPAITCSYKAAAGFLYPLERGFIYIHKPPIHIRFEEIASVNFARSGGSTRSFDFEIDTKSGVIHTFSSIEKGEYPKLFDFIIAKKIRVKNTGKNDKPSYAEDFMNDSDQEAEPDAYLARVKAEAEERSDDDLSDEGSEDEDYKPDKQKLAQSDDDSGSSSGSKSDDEERSETSEASDSAAEEMAGKVLKKKEKKPAAKSTAPSSKAKEKKTGKEGKGKKEKDKNAPKRPASGYMIWYNAKREEFKKKYPDLSITEMSKKAGSLWREMSDTEKKTWEEKSNVLKKEYKIQMEAYLSKKGKESSPQGKKASSSKSQSQRKSVAEAGSPSKEYKSKEFISDSGSSSESDSDKKKKKAPSKKGKRKEESEPEESGSNSD